MKLQFQAPVFGAPHHLSPWCALLASTPPAPFQPRLKISRQLHANYDPTNPASASIRSSTYSGTLSLNPKTIEST
jgi:hypothetical protein